MLQEPFDKERNFIRLTKTPLTTQQHSSCRLQGYDLKKLKQPNKKGINVILYLIVAVSMNLLLSLEEEDSLPITA